jgi:predicted amidophosphoribosyltransferase
VAVSGDARGSRWRVYVPSREVSHAGHELTQKILRSKTSQEHDPLLARLLHGVATRNYPSFKPDLVVSLPPKPGEEDRFRNIRRALAGLTGAADAGSALADTRVVPNYRRMSAAQRVAASDMRYLAAASVRANSVLLIDDVLTTGAQASDAIRALVAAGATEVRFACVARAIEGPGNTRAASRTTMPLGECGRSLSGRTIT